MKYFNAVEKLKALLMQKGADDVVLSLYENNTNQLKFSNNVINTTQVWDTFSLHVFVAVAHKIVSTVLHKIPDDPLLLEKEADKIINFASLSREDKHYGGIAQGPFNYKDINELYDKRIAQNDFDAVDILEKGIQTALEHGAKRTAGIFETSTLSHALITSNDVQAESKSTSVHFSLRAFADKDASGHSIVNHTLLSGCDVVAAAKRAAHIARDALNPQSGQAGSYDVLFEPFAASSFIGAAGSAASAFAVESGFSCFTDALNTQVANQQVCLDDAPHLSGNIASAIFDDEGVPTKHTPIIEQGVLKTYLHNTSTAKRFNTITTANAGLLSPEPHSIVLQNGNFNKTQLFEHIKRGLWITNVWYTRFQNYESGDFSTIPRDGIFLIENGEIVSSLKNIRVSENILNMLKNITAIGNDPAQTTWWESEGDSGVTTPSCVG